MADFQSVTKDGSSHEVCVVACVDAKFAPLAEVLATSLALSASKTRPIVFHVLFAGPDSLSLDRLSQFAMDPVSIVIHRVENPLQHLPAAGRFPPITYLRLLIPQVLRDVDRAGYLDVDTVLLDDIGELFDSDLKGHAIGAARDLGIWVQRDQPANWGQGPGTIRDYLKANGLGGPGVLTDYFNSGVLLFDLEAWRRRDLSAALLSAAPDFALHKWPDQDLLNFTFRDQVAWLDARWNILIEPILNVSAFVDAPDILRQSLARQVERPGLVHFANMDRPWEREGKLPFAEHWWAAVNRSTAKHHFERYEPLPVKTLPRWRRAVGRLQRASSMLLRGHA